MNYRRYQKLWDEHEEAVAQAFAQKRMQRFGPASKTKKKGVANSMLVR